MTWGSPHLVSALRGEGHEAVHLVEFSAGTLSDSEILARAQDKDEVLLVHDLDFPLLMAASGSRSPSVIVFRLRNMRPENVLTYLRKVLSTAADALEQGAIVSVSEGAVRIRSLPLGDG